MPFIDRKAINLSARREATSFLETLWAVVAIVAQTLQCAEPERRVIAFVWLDVVCCMCCLSNTSICTRTTPWFD
jgi:hypothetical protein